MSQFPAHIDDEDLRLARYLDQVVRAADPSEKHQPSRKDPLLPFLSAYKSEARLKVDRDAGDQVWESMKKSMTVPFEAEPMNIRWVPLLVRVAALLAVTILMGLFFFFSGAQKPELLAESASEKSELMLDNGTQVILRPNSQLFLINRDADEQHYKLLGEGFFNVPENQSVTFSIFARDAVVTVKGTRFSVGTWDKHTKIYLQKGSVLVALQDGSQPIVLSQGATALVDHNSIQLVQGKDSPESLGWLSDELELDSRPLSSIAREISHHFNITVHISPELQEEELSGTLALDNPQHILHDIAVSTGSVLEEPEPGYFQLRRMDSN